MSCEPILTDEDLELWGMWQRAALAHAESRRHRQKVDSAKRTVDEAMTRVGSWVSMWSAGKDSTAMVCLLSEMGLNVPAISEKDDLDFPGEREYLEEISKRWGIDLSIVSPEISLREWVRANADRLSAGEDFHSRAAELSKEHFYSVVEAASAPYDGIFLGLRQEESHGRRMNRATRGRLYKRASGQWTCSPIVDWSGLDVMAYMASRDVDPLHVYKCVSFMHSREPWRIRKSWWIPGASSRYGGVAWLRRYYPSLYRDLSDMLPDASQYR